MRRHQRLVERDPVGKGIAEQRGNVRDRRLERVVGFRIGLEVLLHDRNQAIRQFPVLHQRRGHARVIETEQVALDEVQRQAALVRRAPRLLRQHRHRLVQDQVADVGQQSGDEHAFAVDQVTFGGEIARGDGAVNAAQPELFDVEVLALVIAERVGDRGRQHQILDLANAEDRDRVFDRLDLRGEAEVGAVDQVQQARGQARVVGDQR